MKKLSLMLLAFVLLASCTATGKPFVQLNQVPKGKALVYIYRPATFYGGAVSEDVMCNGYKIAELRSGTYIVRSATPGRYKIHPRTMEPDEPVVFNVEAGRTYYVSITVKIEFLWGRHYADLVDPTIARKEIAKCKSND